MIPIDNELERSFNEEWRRRLAREGRLVMAIAGGVFALLALVQAGLLLGVIPAGWPF